MSSPQTIAVIGAGTMGAGIAQACVLAGFLCVMIDVDEERVARGNAAVASALQRLVTKGKLSDGERQIALARLHGTTDYSALRVCDLIVEAAIEKEAL